jgi:deoxyadenosine/deoxycytidine kinase
MVKKWFSVEGNIGSGKSTFCKLFAEKYDNINICLEPVNDWINLKDDSSDKNILQNFYDEPQRWSYTFQNYAAITRVNNLTKPTNKEIKITERSIYTDKNVFAKSLYETGQMSSLEWKMYNEWYIWLENITIEKIGKPSGFIYLRCDPEVSYKRLKIRSRNEESTVSLQYLEMLHKSHDDWLMINKKDFNSMIIDVNEDFENNESVRNHIFNQIDTFVNGNSEISYEY